MSEMMIVMLILLVALLVGGYGQNSGWGPYAWSPAGIVAIVLIVLLLTGKLR